MPESNSQDVTELLRKWSDGDAEALEELAPVVHAELHKIAKRQMRRERAAWLIFYLRRRRCAGGSRRPSSVVRK